MRGFTLIEMMIVAGIVVILVIAAVPALNAITGANARQATGELAGIRFASGTRQSRSASSGWWLR